MNQEQDSENTDRELWREREGDYYADSIHVTRDDGGIGINCGGTVIVKPLREWHRLAEQLAAEREVTQSWFTKSLKLEGQLAAAVEALKQCIEAWNDPGLSNEQKAYENARTVLEFIQAPPAGKR